MADGPLPEPPPAQGQPALIKVPPARWWRVHVHDARTGRYAGDAFNDSGRGNARFSPLRSDRKVIPMLYVAATLEAALMETVLHDVPYPSAGYIHDLARDLSGPLHVSQVELTQSLQLVDLTRLGLQRFGLRPSQMFQTNADDYPRTRRWCQYLRRQMAQAAGLVWMSARQPEARALLLFGDCVASGVVRPLAGPRPLRDAAIQRTVLRLLQRLGCGVAPNL
jgi:RES domain